MYLTNTSWCLNGRLQASQLIYGGYNYVVWHTTHLNRLAQASQVWKLPSLCFLRLKPPFTAFTRRPWWLNLLQWSLPALQQAYTSFIRTDRESIFHTCGSPVKIVQASFRSDKVVIPTIDDLWCSLMPVIAPGNVKRSVFTTINVLWNSCKPLYVQVSSIAVDSTIVDVLWRL